VAPLVRERAGMSSDTLFAEAQAHHREGRIAEADAIYRRILAADPDHPDALQYLAVIDMEAGRLEAAEQGLRRSAALKPREPSVHVNLGHLLARSRRWEEALGAFRAALAIDPFRVGAVIGLGTVLRETGRHDEAVRTARKAVAIEPRNALACALLGAALQDAGQSEAAIEWLERAVALRPDDARSYYNLGAARQSTRRFAEAIEAYRQALRFDPHLASAHNNLGVVLVDQDDPGGAVAHLSIAQDLSPRNPVVHNNLGRALVQLGRFHEALICFGRALALDPHYAEAMANTGAAERGLGRFQASEVNLRKAIALKDDFAEAHANLGLTLRDLGRLDAALVSVERSIELRSDIAEMHGNLGLVLNDMGWHGAALASARRASALKPNSAETQRALLGILVYAPEWQAAQHFAEHLRYARVARSAATASTSHSNTRDPERRLRIGYISSDLRTHPIARNMLPIFTNRDREAFETFVYADIATPNAVTRQCQDAVDQWRVVTGFSDAQLAQVIREDGIDVLVILAGRFDRNRPAVAAHRPAPVQVSFHDPATSGFAEVDYLIADPVLIPPAMRERFSERVAYLPSFYIHDPLSAPEVGPLPMRANGHVTFGMLNNPAKLSDAALALFAAVLRRVPDAHLLFRFRDRYASAALRERVLAALTGAGIAAERIDILQRESADTQGLSLYNRIDIALDPAPFTGSTSTFESLWMGVPVVTLRGETMVGRWSSSMLKAVGQEQWAADTPEAYAEAAARLAGDPDELAALRAGLRQTVAASPLCDSKRRARQLERLFRAFWRRWCGAGKGA
jgi:protein O-GlcNAc transferase